MPTPGGAPIVSHTASRSVWFWIRRGVSFGER